jgi:hypothetical protein
VITVGVRATVPIRNVKKKKMTQGWVVYGGMRHAEPQREMFSRSYDIRNVEVLENLGIKDKPAQQKVQASMAHVAAAHLNRIVSQYRRPCARINKPINANKTGIE